MQQKVLFQFPFLLVYKELGRRVYDTRGFTTREELDKFLSNADNITHFEIYTKTNVEGKM